MFELVGLKAIPEELTTLKKLRNSILHGYDPYSIPIQDDNHLMIDATIDIHHVDLVGCVYQYLLSIYLLIYVLLLNKLVLRIYSRLSGLFII